MTEWGLFAGRGAGKKKKKTGSKGIVRKIKKKKNERKEDFSNKMTETVSRSSAVNPQKR